MLLCIQERMNVIMNVKQELTKGSSSMLVLSVLEKEDLYGYMIIKKIAEKSENVFLFKEGTLYPILHNFEANGYLKSYWVESEGRKRKYYHITKKGLKELEDTKKEWESYSIAVGKVLHGNTAPAAVL